MHRGGPATKSPQAQSAHSAKREAPTARIAAVAAPVGLRLFVARPACAAEAEALASEYGDDPAIAPMRDSSACRSRTARQLLRQCLHFCTSKASKLSNSRESMSLEGCEEQETVCQYLYCFTSTKVKILTHLRSRKRRMPQVCQYLYFPTSKASNLRTCEEPLTRACRLVRRVSICTYVLLR